MDELEKIIRDGQENRHVEFKCSMNWRDEKTQAQVLKAALAFANTEGGGFLVFGMAKASDGAKHEVEGMTEDDCQSFDSDIVQSTINSYASPYVDLSIEQRTIDEKKLVAIRVNQFKDYPAMCTKDGILTDENTKHVVRRGRLYCRSGRMPESTEVQGADDFREIINLAVERGIERYFRLRRVEGVTADSNEFQREVDDIEGKRGDQTDDEGKQLTGIMDKGHWVVRIHPSAFIRERIASLGELDEILEDACVGGNWRYPHWPGYGCTRGNNYILAISPGLAWPETWRLYQSGHFVQHLSMHEDWNSPSSSGRELGSQTALIIMTQMFRFAARLARRVPFDKEVVVSYSLHSVKARRLMVGARLEPDFGTRAVEDKLEHAVSLPVEELIAHHDDQAVTESLWVYERFQWSPSRVLIENDQDNLLG